MRQKGDAYSDAMPRQAGHNGALNTALSHYADEQLQLWQAICATQLDYIVIYNREGYIAQISEQVCALLGLDDTQEPLQLPQEQAVQFFPRDEQGHILPDEHWPVSRILRGEVIKQAEAVDVYIRRTDGHEVLVGVYGAPLYGPNPGNHISGAVIIVREANERRKMEHRTLSIVEALLAIEEALCTCYKEPQGPASRGEEAAYAVEQRLVALPRYLLNCQCAAIALLEPDTLALHPIALAGASLEQERRWRHNSYGVHLRNYLGGSHLSPFLRGLLRNEVQIFDRPLPFLAELSNWGIIAPIQRHDTLSGILLLGYNTRKPALPSQFSSHELAIVRAIAGLAACIAERERQRQAYEQLERAREDAEQEVQQVKRLLRNYLMTLKREFRPMLANIQSQSALLHDHQLEVAEAQAHVIHIGADARRLEFRINEMLEREEATASALPLAPCWFDLNALLVDVANHLRPIAPRHSMRLQLARALPLLWGDQEKLSQVVATLVNSAIKSSPAGGEITITSASEGAIAHVSIRDQGSGANAQELERCLTRQNNEAWLKRTRTETEGLSLACWIIQMHGGQIWIESTQRDGTTIHVTLPFTSDTL
jgi:signal transduction histidine kinase